MYLLMYMHHTYDMYRRQIHHHVHVSSGGNVHQGGIHRGSRSLWLSANGLSQNQIRCTLIIHISGDKLQVTCVTRGMCFMSWYANMCMYAHVDVCSCRCMLMRRMLMRRMLMRYIIILRWQVTRNMLESSMCMLGIHLSTFYKQATCNTLESNMYTCIRCRYSWYTCMCCDSH